jgi:hypothetical protein
MICRKISSKYVRLILTEFFVHFKEQEQSYTWFQQDSTTAHTADNSFTALEWVSGGKIRTSGLWTANSPDLTPMSLSCMG